MTAAPADVAVLMAAVESDPATSIAVDLVAGTCRVGDRTFPIALPPNVREAFETGAWDTTGLLLERYDEVDATSARLPYVNGFPG